MSEDKILKNRFMLWLIIVIVPILGLALSAYEIFYKDKELNLSVEQKVQKLYEDAKNFETKGKIAEAYAKYSTIIDLYSIKEEFDYIVGASEKSVNAIKTNLKNNIVLLAKNKNKKQLRNQRKLVEQILPEELEWLDKQIGQKAQGKNNNRRLKKLLANARKFAKKKNYQKADGFYNKLLSKSSGKIKEAAKKEISEFYYHWAEQIYKTAKEKSDLFLW